MTKQSQPTATSSEKTSEKILRLMCTNPRISIAELATETGVTTRSIERNIDSLRQDGCLNALARIKGALGSASFQRQWPLSQAGPVIRFHSHAGAFPLARCRLQGHAGE